MVSKNGKEERVFHTERPSPEKSLICTESLIKHGKG